MIKCTDGTRFNGLLAVGQTWVKGKTERTIVGYDNIYIYYNTKASKNTKIVLRTSFRKWLHSGAMFKK